MIQATRFCAWATPGLSRHISRCPSSSQAAQLVAQMEVEEMTPELMVEWKAARCSKGVPSGRDWKVRLLILTSKYLRNRKILCLSEINQFLRNDLSP